MCDPECHTRPTSVVHPTCYTTHAPKFRRHRREHNCCGSGGNGRRCPRRKARRESARRHLRPSREGASPRRGWRRRFPKHLVGRRPHLRTRSCEYTHTRAHARHPIAHRISQRPIPRCNTNAYVSSRRATYPRSTRSTAPVLRHGTPFQHVAVVTIGHSHLHYAEARLSGMHLRAQIPPIGKLRCGGAMSTCRGGAMG